MMSFDSQRQGHATEPRATTRAADAALTRGPRYATVAGAADEVDVSAQATFSARLPAVVASVTEGRHLLSEYLETIGYQESYDVCLAATEALSNAVRHGYPSDAHGDIEIGATVNGDSLDVTIRDFGLGPTPELRSESLGLGLALMASLAQRVVLDVEAGKGTDVHLSFRLPRR
jgi:anti-sigma regulatory factor (Ser/Thr protein kinase)